MGTLGAYNGLNYGEQGAAKWLVNGVIDIAVGGLYIGGVQVTATANEINTGTVAGLTATSADLNKMGDVNSSATELDSVVLCLTIPDLSADANYYMVMPYAGTIEKIYSVTNGVVGTADITITASLGGTPVTNAVVTIATAGSAAGDVDSATPSAANTVAAGDALKLAVAGGGSGGSPAGHIEVILRRSS